MKYNELQVSRQKKPMRAGRGISAGRGKTAGRGTKGQGARKSTVKPGFEGGQMPLYMRLPKLRGFKSKRQHIDEVYTGQLDAIKKTVIDNQALFEAGILPTPYTSAKLIVRGEVKTKKTVKVQGASQAAVQAVEKVGGTFEASARQGRPKSKRSDTK